MASSGERGGGDEGAVVERGDVAALLLRKGGRIGVGTVVGRTGGPASGSALEAGEGEKNGGETA